MSSGENIRRLRDQKGLSLRELADRVLINYADLSRIENNLKVLSVPQAVMLARELGCTLDELVG